jgi:membrane carboxypeptidase/penicillin-binding protein
MQAALEGQPQHYFDIPQGTQRIHIHPKTGIPLDATHPDAIPVLARPQSPPSS